MKKTLKVWNEKSDDKEQIYLRLKEYDKGLVTVDCVDYQGHTLDGGVIMQFIDEGKFVVLCEMITEKYPYKKNLQK